MTQPLSFSPAHAPGHLRSERLAGPSRREDVPPANALVTQAAPLPLSKLTGLARALAADGPPIDHVRLASISQAIASGDYRIDAAAIADALLGRSLSTIR